jgi:hypothetical protein
MHNKCMKQNKDLLNIRKLLNYMNNTWHKNIFKVKKNKIKYFYYKYINQYLMYRNRWKYKLEWIIIYVVIFK